MTYSTWQLSSGLRLLMSVKKEIATCMGLRHHNRRSYVVGVAGHGIVRADACSKREDLDLSR